MPQALAGWRPTVVLGGGIGYGDGMSPRLLGDRSGYWENAQTDRDLAQAQATVTQPLYTGGKVQANVNHAKNPDMAERANLIVQEQTSFSNTVNAYVGVIQAQQLLALNVNNEQVLAKQLQATNDRFRVGEITRTDVAQAEAALAGATRGARDRGRQPADRPRHLSAGGRLPGASRSGRAAAAASAGEDRAGGRRAGRGEQSERDHGAVQRRRGEGCDRRGVRPAHAAGQPAGPDVPAEQRRRPLRTRSTATW